ncbi:MAG: FAD binding domain-containing protein [Acetobacteraceae bacterium]|jgi:xanthine dehydrogenase YagS FAD-binding subunit
MDRFSWQSARSVAEAATFAKRTVAEAMLADPDKLPDADCVVLKAGGIDLLDLMKEGLLRPNRVVNLRALPGLDTIAEADDGMRIGAMVTLEQLAAHPGLRQRCTALADAAGSSGSPQIRHVATLGGNLLQRPRCWYFRSAAHHCARKGGDHCFAFAGENQYHAVFGHDGCAIVHPSTVATALVAFNARIELVNAQGETRVVALAAFLVGPDVDVRRETDLRAGEVMTAVILPPMAAGARSVFLKQAERASSDWSVADVAVVLERGADGRCKSASIVLGAAAPVPWRAQTAEAALTGKTIDPAIAQGAGEAAIAGAQPLRHNAWKLPILSTLVRRAVLRAADVQETAQ